MSSPRSPRSRSESKTGRNEYGDDEENKQWEYRIEKVRNELEMEKVKTQHLTDDNDRLKKQLADGEKRSDKINKVSAMIKEFQIQIQEAHEENQRLTDELESTIAERDEGFAVRDDEIERLKALLAQAGAGGAQDDAMAAENERLRAENAALLAEKNKLKERLVAAKQELQKLQIQIDLPSMEGDITIKSPNSKIIKALEERVKQLESSLAAKNKYILEELRRS